ncbi:MAG: nucleotide exchange factor GrpE [Steroidobacteraceae bacterium]
MSQESRNPSRQNSGRDPAADPPADARSGTHEMIREEPIEDGGERRGAQPAEIEALRQELAVMEDNVRTQRELYLRAAAEIDNVRKRAQRDIEQAHRYGIEGFAAELLAVRDSLELGVRNGASADAATLLAGQEATLKLLDRAFEKFSIRQLDPIGERFDPNQHEAMLMQEAVGAEPNSVLQVVQAGYELNGRLLRPARVIVAKAADEP